MRKVGIGVVGLGRFGINYVKTIESMSLFSLRGVCAQSQASIKNALQFVGDKKIIASVKFDDLLKSPSIEAVCIVTPAHTHFSLAMKALFAGKHVLIEKPICFKAKELEDLIKITKQKRKILLAGHLHLFNPPLMQLVADVKKGMFGRVNMVRIEHANNGPIRKDVSIIWDYFPHAASLLSALIKENPKKIIAVGNRDAVSLEIEYLGKAFSTSFASWKSPKKVFSVMVIGEKMAASYDDYVQADKLKYYSKSKGKDTFVYNSSFYVPAYSDIRPLTRQLVYFRECIVEGKLPEENLKNALAATRILERAQKSFNGVSA